MEKKNFIKRAKLGVNLFLVKQFLFVLISTIVLSIITLFSNSLVSICLLSTLIFINYLMKSDSYSDFSLYKLLYYSNRFQTSIIVLIIISGLISYQIIDGITEIYLFEYFEVFYDDFEFMVKHYSALSATLLYSIIISIANYISLYSRFNDLLDDKIYDSKYYFKRIQERQQSPRDLKKYLLNQSETPDFWYVSEKNEEDLVNDLFYRGYLD